MPDAFITIDSGRVADLLRTRGWTKGMWESPDGAMCLHAAIRACQPVPGDAYLLEQVAAAQGWGTQWNDAPATTEGDAMARIDAGMSCTADELATVFGPQWRAVASLVRRAAVLTTTDARALAAARAAARTAAGAAAWDAARTAAGTAARIAARTAAWAAVTWDLATPAGAYTTDQRGRLMAPWRSVCGLPKGLVTGA